MTLAALAFLAAYLSVPVLPGLLFGLAFLTALVYNIGRLLGFFRR